MRKVGLVGPVYAVATARTESLLSQTWSRSLGAAGILFVVGSFQRECADEEIAQGVERANSAGARVVIGVGGGKALDTARAVAATVIEARNANQVPGGATITGGALVQLIVEVRPTSEIVEVCDGFLAADHFAPGLGG